MSIADSGRIACLCGSCSRGVQRRSRNTPAGIVDKLNETINAALADPGIRARISDMGVSPLGGAPANFGKLIADETDKWGKVIRLAGIKAS